MRDEARDAVMGMLNTALTGMSDDVTILWDADEAPIPGAEDSWVRLSMRHQASPQSSLGRDAAAKRRYRTSGMVYVQLFTPLGDGQTKSDAISKVIVDAMRAGRDTSSVLLRNAVAKEIGVDGSWFQVNVQSEFEYDEFV